MNGLYHFDWRKNMDKWKCVCGNYNTENVCLKCGRLKDNVYIDFFE